MTADTSHNDNENNDEFDESTRKRLLIGLVLGIILLGIVLNRTGFINFEKKTTKTNVDNPGTDSNGPVNPETKNNHKNDALKQETLYKRFTKNPMSYYQYDPEELRPEYVQEAYNQFQLWLEGKLPGSITDTSAQVKMNEIPLDGEKIIVNKTSVFPENAQFPENWQIIDSQTDNSVLCIVIPPSKSPLPSEYWIKFIVFNDNVGKVYSFSLLHTAKNGYIWKFTGISFE